MSYDDDTLKAAVTKRHPGCKDITFDHENDTIGVVVGGVDSLTVVPLCDAEKWAAEDVLTAAVTKRYPGSRSATLNGDVFNVISMAGKLSVVTLALAKSWAAEDAVEPKAAVDPLKGKEPAPAAGGAPSGRSSFIDAGESESPPEVAGKANAPAAAPKAS
jgi:hypothetical protein